MRLLRRILGAIVLFLATVGMVCCAAGVYGVWILRSDVAQKVEAIDARVEVGVQRTSAILQSVQDALQNARDHLAQVSKKSADLGPEPEKNRLAGDVLRMLIHQQLGPKINDIGGRLATFSDAAMAVTSLLQSFQELPIGKVSGIDPHKLESASDLASQLASALQKLQAKIGEGDKAIAKQEVAAAATTVELVLQRCQTMVDDWQSDLGAGQTEIAHIKASLLGWVTPVAVAVTLLLAWGMLSQLSLAAHAWNWFRGA